MAVDWLIADHGDQVAEERHGHAHEHQRHPEQSQRMADAQRTAESTDRSRRKAH